MCFTVAPTTLGRSVTGNHEADENTHVTWYQNAVLGLTPGRPRRGVFATTGTRQALTAPRRTTRRTPTSIPDNWDDGSDNAGATGTGNGLVIPLLTDDFASIRLLDTEKTPHILTDIRRALQPSVFATDSRRVSKSVGAADTVIVQNLGIYTLVLASRASLIPDAVNSSLVEPRKRPPVNQEGFDAIDKGYDCPVAIACFDNNDSGDSLPIAYAYAPRYKNRFMLYTLDGHGGRPDLNAYVEMDHVLFASSYRLKKGTTIHYRDSIPAELEAYVPRQAVGQVIPKGTMVLNGDVLVKTDDVARGVWSPQRVIPPKATPKRKPMPFADAIKKKKKKR